MQRREEREKKKNVARTTHFLKGDHIKVLKIETQCKKFIVIIKFLFHNYKNKMNTNDYIYNI